MGDWLVAGGRSADSLVRQQLDAKTAFRLKLQRPHLIVPRVLRCPHHGLLTLDEVRRTAPAPARHRHLT